MRIIGNIKVGRPHTTQSKSSHTFGVRQGNRPHTVMGESGVFNTGKHGAGRQKAKAKPERSTGINPEQRRPIDPNMPFLTPA